MYSQATGECLGRCTPILVPKPLALLFLKASLDLDIWGAFGMGARARTYGCRGGPGRPMGLRRVRARARSACFRRENHALKRAR